MGDSNIVWVIGLVVILFTKILFFMGAGNESLVPGCMQAKLCGSVPDFHLMISKGVIIRQTHDSSLSYFFFANFH